MSAADVVSGEQFPEHFQYYLFQQAGKLRDEHQAGDFVDDAALAARDFGVKAGNRTVQMGWRQKLRESKSSDEDGEPSLHEDISQHGVKEPVVLYDGSDRGDLNSRKMGAILNGHHRVAAAADIDPEMEVPVRWARHPWSL